MSILDKDQFKYLKDGCRPVNNDYAEAIMKLVEAVEVLTEALKTIKECAHQYDDDYLCTPCVARDCLEKVWGKDVD